ncbi:MAG: hypothetical protein EOO46_01510 [Flavobacterium sp.]|nr:MAG: hypothetical protein EOO46_01510 [Flavobacterium sp.]
MKNITKSLIALFTVLAISCSPDDVEDRPIVTPIDAPVLLGPEGNNSYVLLPENLANQAERFVWTEANFDQDVAINYTVQLDIAGNEFANAQDLGSIIGSTQLSVTVETLNGKVIAAGGAPFVEGTFEVRVKASVNEASEPMYSNVATISVTPYTTETPKLWVAGGYQAASGYGSDWAHATAPTLASEGFGNAKFEGYVYIATAQDGSIDGQGFKFSSQANWDGTNYGDDGSFSGVLSATGENMSAAAGYYRIEADTDALTYKLTNTSWGVIGNATPGGWENSTPMTYDSATKKWSVTVAMTAQTAPDNGWKFRANNGWEINLGDTTVNSTDGTLRYGGDNIGIAASGTYKIELDLSNPRAYKYTITLQ